MSDFVYLSVSELGELLPFPSLFCNLNRTDWKQRLNAFCFHPWSRFMMEGFFLFGSWLFIHSQYWLQHFYYSACKEALHACFLILKIHWSRSLSLDLPCTLFGYNLNWQAQLFCMQGGNIKDWVNPLWFPAAVTHTVSVKATKCSRIK